MPLKSDEYEIDNDVLISNAAESISRRVEQKLYCARKKIAI